MNKYFAFCVDITAFDTVTCTVYEQDTSGGSALVFDGSLANCRQKGLGAGKIPPAPGSVRHYVMQYEHLYVISVITLELGVITSN